MKRFWRAVWATAFAVCSLPAIAGATTSSAAQWTAPVPSGECDRRAPIVLKQRGLSPKREGRFWYATAPGITAYVICSAMGRGNVQVTIFASSDTAERPQDIIAGINSAFWNMRNGPDCNSIAGDWHYGAQTLTFKSDGSIGVSNGTRGSWHSNEGNSFTVKFDNRQYILSIAPGGQMLSGDTVLTRVCP